MTANPIQKQLQQKRNSEIKKLYPLLTLAEIGKRYHLTRERIRQILATKDKKDELLEETSAQA